MPAMTSTPSAFRDIFRRLFSPVALMMLASFIAPVLSGSEPLDGIWRSLGYGYVFELQGGRLRAFDVTDDTCVRNLSAKKEARSVSGSEATFRGPDGLVLSIRSGGTADHRIVHIDGAASDIRIDRLPRKPAVCDQPTADTPLANFDVFAQTWAEHYISFNVKHVDWSTVVTENRAKITPNTTPA